MQKDTINNIKKLNTILKYTFSHLSAFGQSPYMVLMQINKEPQNNNKICLRQAYKKTDKASQQRTNNGPLPLDTSCGYWEIKSMKFSKYGALYGELVTTRELLLLRISQKLTKRTES